MMSRTHLFATVGLLTVLILTAPATEAAAQSALASSTNAAADSATAVGEIVVTARRKAESLQNVPLAITAVTATELQEAAATSLQDVTFLTPGLTLNSGGAEAFEQPVIRGLSDTSGGFASASNVSIFLDGIYLQNYSAFDLSLVGLDRVEVVKGPVSGLYGRNAFAGAINYVTGTPSQAFHTEDAVTFGSFAQQTYQLDVTGPILPHVLAARISGAFDSNEGSFTDPITHLRANGHLKRDILASLLFTPDSHITIKPVLYYGNDKFAPPLRAFLPKNCSPETVQTYCGNLEQNQLAPVVTSGQGADVSGNSRNVFHFHVDAKAQYEFGSFDLLAGYFKVKTDEIDEFTGTESGIPYDVYAPGKNNTFAGNPPLPGGPILAKSFYGLHFTEEDSSLEGRYDTPQNLPVRASAGGFYFHHAQFFDGSFGIDNQNIPAGDVLNSVSQRYVTAHGASAGPLSVAHSGALDYSGFGEAEVDLLKTLTLSGTIRYTSDEQKLSNLTYSGLKTTFGSWTSNSSLTWKPTPRLTLYIDGANGEKSGGFNQQAQGPLDLTYLPETDWNVEGGFRANVMNHLRVEADVFHTVLSSLQVAGPPATQGAIATVVKNFGSVAATGAEFDSAYSDHGITAQVGVGFTDPRFDSTSYDYTGNVASCLLLPSCAPRVTTVRGLQAIKLVGLTPPFASRWTFNASLGYRHSIGTNGVQGFVRGDYRLESRQYNTVTDFAYYGPRNLVNLHAGLTLKAVTLELNILNATNDRTPIGTQYNAQLNTFDAAPNGYLGVNWNSLVLLPDPTAYQVRLSYKY